MSKGKRLRIKAKRIMDHFKQPEAFRFSQDQLEKLIHAMTIKMGGEVVIAAKDLALTEDMVMEVHAKRDPDTGELAFHFKATTLTRAS